MNPYPKGDVRYTDTFDESLASYKTTTLEEAKKFYGDYFGASNAELAVVGDFDDAEIAKLAAELFGDWKSPAALHARGLAVPGASRLSTKVSRRPTRPTPSSSRARIWRSATTTPTIRLSCWATTCSAAVS